MGTLSDIGSLATEKSANRRAWGKAIVSATLSAVVSIVGTTWKARGYVDEIERQQAEAKKDLEYLRAHLPEVEKVAIDAKAESQATSRLLYAHLGGWPVGVK